MKAILVIDKPECCTSCLLGIYNKKWFCLVTNKDIDITDRYNIPSWCPLKPMPEKYEYYDLNEQPEEILANAETRGRNACIEEITGETE